MMMRIQWEDFEIVEKLGEGSFAEVFAVCLKEGIKCLQCLRKVCCHDKSYAIKRIKHTSKTEKYLKSEKTIHWSLDHSNIIKLYETFDKDGYTFLVLELCDKTLDSYIDTKEGKGLSETYAWELFYQIYEGVKYLHSQNVMHRDLSLKNILLTKDKKVKIADFGLSTKLSNSRDTAKSVVGTPMFMAPEVSTEKSQTLKGDVWALGCILYVLLVGKFPFNKKNFKDTVDSVIKEDVSFPIYLSKEAKELLQDLLAKRECRRPRVKDLEDYDFFKKYVSPKVKESPGSGVVSMGSSTSHNQFRRYHRMGDSGLGSSNSKEVKVRQKQFYYQQDSISSTHNSRSRTSSSKKHNEPYRLYDRELSARGGKTVKQASEILPSHNKFFPDRDVNKQYFSEGNKNVIQYLESPDYRTENEYLKQKCASLEGEISCLNTARLPPRRHSLKNAFISLMEDGMVYVELCKTRNSITYVHNVCTVTGDGKYMHVCKLNPSQPVGQQPIQISEYSQVKFKYPSFPKKYRNMYKYAKMFVDILRASTPKVIIYGEKAKLVMCENAPNPNFEMKFYNGDTVTKKSDKISIETKNGRTYNLVEKLSITDPILNTDKTFKPLWEEFKKMKEQCETLEEHLKEIMHTGIKVFPVIVGKVRSQLNSRSGNNNKENISNLLSTLNTGDKMNSRF